MNLRNANLLDIRGFLLRLHIFDPEIYVRGVRICHMPIPQMYRGVIERLSKHMHLAVCAGNVVPFVIEASLDDDLN